jgi:ProP effector
MTKINPTIILGILSQCGGLPCLKQPRRPLAIGAGPELCERIMSITGCTSLEASVAVRFSCRSIAYLRGCRAGATRIDVDGNPAGEVTADEAAFAAETLAKALRRRDAKQGKRVNPVTGRAILSLKRPATKNPEAGKISAR